MVLVDKRNRAQANCRRGGAQACDKLLCTAAQKELKQAVRAYKIEFIAAELAASAEGVKDFWAVVRAVDSGGGPQSRPVNQQPFFDTNGNVCTSPEENCFHHGDTSLPPGSTPYLMVARRFTHFPSF
jgi:hypothetical protein